MSKNIYHLGKKVSEKKMFLKTLFLFVPTKTVPSGVVQSIEQTMFEEKESIHLNFTELLPMETRGEILHYNVSLNKMENPWDDVNDTTRFFNVATTDLKWSQNGLDNYTEYYIKITAYNVAGPGPSREVIFRTATNSKIT